MKFTQLFKRPFTKGTCAARSLRATHAASAVASRTATGVLRVVQSLISQQSLFVMPPKFQPPLYDHRLPREDCAADIQYGIWPGEPRLIGYTEDEVWDHIMAPIEKVQCQALRDHGRPDLLPLLPRYNAFLILLGMVRPMQVDGVGDRKGLLYNTYMANMLTRRQYYLLQRLLCTDVVSLLENCNGQWAGAWCMGGGACGDESVVPHKRMLAGPLKMFIARKPHPTGIKLYCLADATLGYVVDMYLYTGVWGRLRRYGTAAGNFDAKNIMKLWASLLPEGTVLCADSFFGLHGLAKELAANKRAFLLMTTRSTYRRDMGWGADARGADGGVHCCGFQVQYVHVQESEGRAQNPPRCAAVYECVVCPKGTTSPAKRARSAPRGGGVPHTVARCRWCESDGPADEAGWPPDDMGPHGVCVCAPVRGCECVHNLPAIGTLQGDH